MIESCAFRVLSLSARRILNRLEIEHASHGGRENGRLATTYDDFEEYGMHRHAVSPAIREAVSLGFVRVTEVGRAGNAEFRKPNRFRLTYLKTNDANETDEWRSIVTLQEAEQIARVARLAKAPKKQNSSGGKRQFLVADSATENGESIVRESALQA
jgi:hypothetical protein